MTLLQFDVELVSRIISDDPKAKIVFSDRRF